MKLRYKFLLCSIGIIVGIGFLFFFTNLLFLSIEQAEITREKFNISVMIESMKSNEFHGLIFLTLLPMVLLSVMAITFLSSGRNGYKSEYDIITDDIKTPKAIGQLQHGSARWLTKKEKELTFATFKMDTKKYPIINFLLRKGIDDYAKIKEEVSED